MPYFNARSIAHGTYIAPQQAYRGRIRINPRRPVRLHGHYGLGQGTLTSQTSDAEILAACQRVAAGIPFPDLRAKMIASCVAQLQARRATLPPPPAPPAPSPVYPSPSPLAPPMGAPVGPAPLVPPATSYADPSVAGTPVPPGFGKNQIYVDGSGNQWMYNQSTGTWQNATAAAMSLATSQEQAQAAQIAAATATSPSGGPAPILVTSPVVSPTLPNVSTGIPGAPVNVSVSTGSSTYQDILNWLSESTLISPIPNWVIAGAGVLVAMKLAGGKGKFL